MFLITLISLQTIRRRAEVIITAVNIYVEMKVLYPNKTVVFDYDIPMDHFVFLRKNKRGVIKGKLDNGRVFLL